MFQINKHKDRILFDRASEVREDEFGEELESTLSKMATTMYGSRGVGIAGPQVGIPKRILVADLGYVDGKDYGSHLVKMVNPEIIADNNQVVKAEEGCLSYPGLAVKVDRPTEITVRFFSPDGDEHEETYQGWQARIIMHEIDHLNGVTLYSRAGLMKKKRYDRLVKKGKL